MRTAFSLLKPLRARKAYFANKPPQSEQKNNPNDLVIAALMLSGGLLCTYAWVLIIGDNFKFYKDNQARLKIENSSTTEVSRSIDSKPPRA